MAAIAQDLEHPRNSIAWLWDFLRHELAPYKGRAVVVARIVTASTLIIIICMTFRIPFGPIAAIYALLISRESLQTTANLACIFIGACLFACAYLIVGAMLVLGSAMLRFLWVGATLFLVFFCLSAMRNYAAAVTFGLVTTSNIPLWESHTSVESKVENTLWNVGAVAIGIVITLLIEVAFARFRRIDELTEAISERLVCMEELLTSYGNGQEVAAAIRTASLRLATVGTSRLRRMLHRSGYEPPQKEHFGALLALVGRLVDLGANLINLSSGVPENHRKRIREVAQNIAEIRASLMNGTSLDPATPSVKSHSWPEVPLVAQIEETTSLIRGVFVGSLSATIFTYAPSEEPRPSTLFVRGAITNSSHVKFALKGCLAAGLSYITFNALFWPGIASSVYTCVITAFTTIGASHQKQILRLAGALIGGIVLGMGAQVFILPFIDSITAFALLFTAITCAAAWVATSSTRLSFLGVQAALAFNLVTLQGFKFQTSLLLARDRVIGVVLGLAMMWLVFDALWSTRAAVEMKKAFVSVIRLLAQFAREPVSEDWRMAIDRSYTLREIINAKFDEVRSIADSIIFEFGPSRHQDLALRDCIREWQPRLRTLFLMRVVSTNYRLQLSGFELPQAVRLWHREYDYHSAKLLDNMADWIEGTAHATQISTEPLGEIERRISSSAKGELPANIVSFVTLLRGMGSLTSSVAEEIAGKYHDEMAQPNESS
jgi:multidrug resistance protein MdtO